MATAWHSRLLGQRSVLNPNIRNHENMTSIVFENDGEIDPRAIATFGCNVKESENPIGFFGTGLKYALAVLMQLRQSVVIQSGLKSFVVETREEIVRGKAFLFVVMRDGLSITPLGFTTELGKNWKPWMAYRELFCNMKDEKGCVFKSDSEMPACAGKTRVIVGGEIFSATHDSASDFILDGSPDFKIGTVEVRRRSTASFFYRGIKVMEFHKPALFCYNETGAVTLTEDRTVKDPYMVLYGLSRAILSHAERPMLESVLVADQKNIESMFDYHGWADDPGADFYSTVNSLQRVSLSRVNLSALRLWREKGGGFVDPRRVQPSKLQKAMLEKAIVFCERSGFKVRDEYPIIVVETLGEEGTLALADRKGNQIFLTERVFHKGTKYVARALIEEYAHLKFGYDDCSRELQNFLFDKLVSVCEELTGEPL